MQTGRAKTRYIARSAVIFAAGLIFLLPVLLVMMNSLKPNGEILTSFLSPPKSLYLENFAHAMESMNFWLSFRNSLVITVLSVVGATFFSFLCAYGISHLRGRISNTLYMAFVLGQIVPFHAVMIAISVLASATGLNNSLWGIVVFYCGFYSAFGVMTFTGFMKSVPRELEEAAAIDGCSIWKTMMRIVFPLLLPSTVTLAVLFFLWTWNDFLFPSIMLSDNALKTITVNLFLFRSATSTQWNLLIAGLTLSMLPIIAIYIGAQKYITEGLIAGAIK